MIDTKQTTERVTRIHTRRAVVTDLEFAFWTAVVLLPLFFYLNGPSVSDDQWWIRLGLLILAYAGAPLSTLMRRRRNEKTQDKKTEPDQPEDSTAVRCHTAVEK